MPIKEVNDILECVTKEHIKAGWTALEGGADVTSEEFERMKHLTNMLVDNLAEIPIIRQSSITTTANILRAIFKGKQSAQCKEENITDLVRAVMPLVQAELLTGFIAGVRTGLELINDVKKAGTS